MDSRFQTGQWNQEKIFDQLFYSTGNEEHAGIFIEVGAWDGVEISNTYYLEKCRNWKGLLVEPITSKAEEAEHNRWSPVWKGCVGWANGETEFLHVIGYSEMLSGINNSIHSKHRERINKEVSDFHQKTEIIKIPCKTLNSLMADYNLPIVDLLSLDVQTAELSVLKAYDPSRHPIKAILMDLNGINKEEISNWFTEHNYKLYWKAEHSDEVLYVNENLPWTWEGSVLFFNMQK
jgi:FkbM family methyltransferase